MLVKSHFLLKISFTSDVETVVNAIELTLSYDSCSERYDDCMYRRKLCNKNGIVSPKQYRTARAIACNRDSGRKRLGEKHLERI